MIHDEVPVTLDRQQTPRGELVLRRRGVDLEVISNGTFLMDTSDGRSERLLVTTALDTTRLPSPLHVVLGGLGVGFSLRAALEDSRVTAVTVVEVEAALLDWHAGPLGQPSDHAITDPRTAIALDDVGRWLRAQPNDSLDVVCLDVDNGPDWPVTDSNADLYGETETAAFVERLRPGGVLAVWSAAPAPGYLARLARHLLDVREVAVPVRRGDPDVVMVGRRPGPGDDPASVSPASAR